MKYIIGVDGGATKTEAIAYDLDDNVIGKGYSSFGNLFLDFNKATENIINAIQQCIESIKQNDMNKHCLCIYLGIAGIEVGENKEKIEELVSKTFCSKVQSCHDSQLAHAAIHKGKDGIIVISGTGSVSYGIYKGISTKSGGWGQILGDEGSGYDIAVSAFKRMVFEEDSGIASSELTKYIMYKMNINKVSDIIKFVYSSTKAEISALAPAVVEIANNSDKNSIDILKRAGQNLAELTLKLYNKLEVKEPINIGISGSILNKVDIVKEEFKRCIEKDIKNITVITENVSATKGACYIHRNLNKKH